MLGRVHSGSVDDRAQRGSETAFTFAASAVRSPSRAWKVAPAACISHQAHLQHAAAAPQRIARRSSAAAPRASVQRAATAAAEDATDPAPTSTDAGSRPAAGGLCYKVLVAPAARGEAYPLGLGRYKGCHAARTLEFCAGSIQAARGPC